MHFTFGFSARFLTLLAIFSVFTGKSFALPGPSGVVFLVDAPAIDLSSLKAAVISLAKTPHARFGHAWVLLKWKRGEKEEYLEGSHSGEIEEPTYLTQFLERCQNNELNPAACFWEDRTDGFFEKGSGGHAPTCAVFIPLENKQVDEVAEFLRTYEYRRYNLKNRQCVTLVRDVAAFLGIVLDPSESLPIDKNLNMFGKTKTIWVDEKYAVLSFPTPNKLQEELAKLIESGQAINVLDSYQNSSINITSKGKRLPSTFRTKRLSILKRILK